jgi:hypothetical protein
MRSSPPLVVPIRSGHRPALDHDAQRVLLRLSASRDGDRLVPDRGAVPLPVRPM